ncbi:basic proline-rich protein-like [Psammomys obesus]|uniref:basic proline-rich protein-like n=1 Tax=Psammomys obesus TaxID=48139 RepID=UPI002452F986|nr:basic proline-rich protein-like [Psammomys obesus]
MGEGRGPHWAPGQPSVAGVTSLGGTRRPGEVPLALVCPPHPHPHPTHGETVVDTDIQSLKQESMTLPPPPGSQTGTNRHKAPVAARRVEAEGTQPLPSPGLPPARPMEAARCTGTFSQARTGVPGGGPHARQGDTQRCPAPRTCPRLRTRGPRAPGPATQTSAGRADPAEGGLWTPRSHLTYKDPKSPPPAARSRRGGAPSEPPSSPSGPRRPEPPPRGRPAESWRPGAPSARRPPRPSARPSAAPASGLPLLTLPYLATPAGPSEPFRGLPGSLPC